LREEQLLYDVAHAAAAGEARDHFREGDVQQGAVDQQAVGHEVQGARAVELVLSRHFALDALANAVAESSQDGGRDAFGAEWPSLEEAQVLGEDY